MRPALHPTLRELAAKGSRKWPPIAVWPAIVNIRSPATRPMGTGHSRDYEGLSVRTHCRAGWRLPPHAGRTTASRPAGNRKLGGHAQRPSPRLSFRATAYFGECHVDPFLCCRTESQQSSSVAAGDQTRGRGARAHLRRRRNCRLRPLLSQDRPLPGNDRRRLCQSQLDDHRAEGFRPHRAGAGLRQPAGESRPVAGADRRPRFSDRAGPGPCRRRGLGSRGEEPQRPDRIAGAADPAAGGGGRRGRSQSEIRAGGARPLRRTDEVWIRHRAARATDRRRLAGANSTVAAGQVRLDRRQQEDRGAVDRARESHSTARPCPRRRTTGGAEILLTRRSPRRSTARSARAHSG